MEKDLPLLLVLDREGMSEVMYLVTLESLRSKGYRPFVLRDLTGTQLTREQSVMLSYQLGLR